MANTETRKERESAHDEARDAWDANAAFWDARFGEGNDFHDVLVAPSTESLLDVSPGERVLDIACGNGAFARRLAELGAGVVAIDQSAALLELARRRTPYEMAVEYRVVDVTDRNALLALGEETFDAAVCNMALMDISEIAPLFETAYRLLVPNGRLVFSVMHPCFNNPSGTRLLAEEVDLNGELVRRHAIAVERYLTPTVARGLGMIGQPKPHYYFHRPLEVLLGTCFRAGFVLDGLRESAFPPGREARRTFSWENYSDIPPVLVARLCRGR